MQIVPLSVELSCHIDFHNGGRCCGILLFCFRLGGVAFFRKVKSYRQTEFRWNNSIHGWDITIYGLEKQTSAILKFFFRFRPRPHPNNRHYILHHCAKLHPDWAICGRVMTSYRFLTWPPPRLNTTSGFVFVDVTVFRRSKSIRRPNLVDMAQFTERYNYFRWRKTNVNHIVILHPVSISTIFP